MADPVWYHYLVPSIRSRVRFRKAAGIFAGMNHMQPLLLATTNANYLLDRFCMERCCSGEYVSRIATSIIFMEILAIIIVRIVLLILPSGLHTIMDLKALKIPQIWPDPNSSNAQQLVNHSKNEEWYRGVISSIILFLIQLGYLQILYAFTTGGGKGHMHWFYVSLMFQHFLNSLIAGSIGFWEVGLALWYLVTLPMAPIIVFFYQLYIHSWIRNNGPRNVEYLVVECQIVLATAISFIATILWMAGYVIPYDSTTLTIPADLANLESQNTDKHVTVQSKEDIKLTKITPQTSSTSITLTVALKPGDPGTITIRVYSVTLQAGSSTDNTATIYPLKVVTLTLTAAENSLTMTLTVKGNLKSNDSKTDVTLTLSAQGSIAPATLTVSPTTIYSGPANFTQQGSGNGEAVNIKSVTLQYEAPSNITNISVSDAQTDTGPPVKVTVKGYTCYPENGHYIYGTTETSAGTVNEKLWNTSWDGGKCEFVECYYKDPGASSDPALLKFYVHVLGTLKIYYFGRNSSNSGWKTLSDNENLDTRAEDKEKAFITKFAELATESLSNLGQDPDTVYANKHNTEFSYVLWDPSKWNEIGTWTTTWAPLIMQGLSVGAVGSIFPNLIPKTLVCPRTTRNLSVMNMFLVTVPHIFNVMLGDMDLLGWIGAGDDWLGSGWHYSLLLYIFYILAILFAIFNIHYPDCRFSLWQTPSPQNYSSDRHHINVFI